MNYFEIVCINFILIIFPIFIYLFYLFYNVDVGKKSSNLFLDFALCTSFYFTIRLGSLITNVPLFLLNVIIFLCYLKERNIAIILSIISIIYYSIIFKFNIYVLIIEYFIYFIIYILFKNNKVKKRNFHIIYILVNILFIFLFNYNNTAYFSNYIIQFIISSITFIIVTISTKILFESGEGVIRFHDNVKKLKEEENIRKSLFKITHEIKNPIAVCKGYLDMFDSENKEHARKYIPIVKKEIESTLILLEDFLSMNKVKIEKDIMDVSLLLEDIKNHFSILLKEKNIVSNISVLDDEIYILGDYNRLMQVCINLIKNSIESMNKELSYINVFINLKKDDVEIIIDDNGIGMSSEVICKIKEPFYTTKRRGTGLGVSLSNEIIEAHNGKLEYISEYGVGTKTIVTLPLYKY